MDRIQSETYDCIVSDYDMSEENGIVFLESVRNVDVDVPFLLFTGKGSEEVASEAISAGVTDYIKKEAGTDQYTILANRIRNAVKRHRAERERQYIRDRMDLALERTDSVIFEIDLTSGAVIRLGEFEHVFDVAADDVPTWQAHLDQVVHPDDRDAFRRFYQQLTEGDRDGGTLEYRTNPALGDVRWIMDEIALAGDGSERAICLARDVTERKQREREREQINTRVTDAIVRVDEAWRFTLVNVQAADLYDVDESDLLGRDFWDVFSDVRGTKFEDEFRTVMETREHTSFVEYYAGLEGWFNVEVYPNDDGGLSFYFQEITERLESEHDLRLMEQIVQEMNDGAVIVQDGIITFANPQVAEMGGYEDGELEDVSMTTFIAPEYRELAHERHLGRLSDEESEPPEVYELAVVSNADERIPVEVSASRITYRGDPAALVLLRDISERKQRDREFHERTRQLQGVLDSVDAAIWIRDPESRFELVNQNFRELFDIDATRDIEGRQPSEVLPEDIASQFRENDRRAIEAGERIEFEEIVETADGTKTYQTRIAPLFDDGKMFATCGIATDITDLKQNQAELERINEQLEGVVSIVSHDLRNPLNVAQGRLELAQDSCESEHLEVVARAHERMEALIEDLLTLAREGSQVSDMEAVALASLVQSCWDVVETADATLDVETNQTIRADGSRLQQLLENLIRNAVEHGNSNVTITVGDLDNGFFVEDNGPGIPPDDRDTVFDAGYSTATAGTGFGLNIVEQIAEAHGWTVQVSDGTDGGARFEITEVESA